MIDRTDNKNQNIIILQVQNNNIFLKGLKFLRFNRIELKKIAKLKSSTLKSIKLFLQYTFLYCFISVKKEGLSSHSFPSHSLVGIVRFYVPA